MAKTQVPTVIATLVFAIAASTVVAETAATKTGESASGSGSIVVRNDGALTRVVFIGPEGSESVVRTTQAAVGGERLVSMPDAGVLYSAWDESAPGVSEHRVSVSLDGGASWTRPQALTYAIPLKAGRLVPGGFAPSLPAELRSDDRDKLFIVQFETTGLEAWRRILRGLGVDLLSYLPEHAHIVRMDPSLVERVASQPFVRWIGRYEPGYKIDALVMADILSANCCTPNEARRYHLQTFTPGPDEKAVLAGEIRALGGRVDLLTPNGYLLDATLTLEQVAAIARSEHLLWIDRWSPPEIDMDIVRQQDGANYIESVASYAGQGVRGEVMDQGVQQNHQDFDGILIHGPAANLDSHGTSTYGIVFGNGARDGDGDAKATSNLPLAEQGWFYDFNNLTDRYQETAELVAAPIFAVFQSNSWGDALTRSYNSISMEMDDIIYLYDVPIFQSQSNAGSQDSRPQAWAKNNISIGAVYHYDTQTLSDDCWCSGASIGPAEDGRIKPDLLYWYDSIYTTTSGGGYTSGFNGTSAATPITAGIGGLFLQMWAENVLGNNPAGTTVFEKRPHAATTKAMMINTAEQYPFSGTSGDKTRTHQGWGLPSARRFYDRAALLKVVDESELLQELDVQTWTASVASGQGELKITLDYTDRAGTTSSTLHRINDVTLQVMDPSGTTTYWGNVGLDAGNWSQPGGAADTKNTVENVFIQNPAPGSWTIEISADDINQDEHSETPEIDQDYALVVYGASSLTLGCQIPPPAPAGLSAAVSGDNRVDLSWTPTATARKYRIYRSLGGCGGTYSLIGTVPSTQSTFSDTKASGGSAYGYVVRAQEGCESVDSNCSAATATGPCLLSPSFAGLDSASGNDAATCGVTLGWPASTANCGGPIRYNVYRSASAGFTPSNDNRVASCLTATSWVDTRNLGSGQTYNYIVRAEDLGGRGSSACGGSSESNTISRSALVRGATGTILNTGFESGLEGWVSTKGSPAATKGDFIADTPTATTKNGQPAQPGSCAAGSRCLFTAKNNGGNADNGDVDGGEVVATSPTFDASNFSTARLTLQRWHFNSAPGSDSGDRFAIDVSNNGGAGWGVMQNLGTASANQWNAVSLDLENYGALTSNMKIRVRSADGPNSDATVESAVDAVLIQGSQQCATQSSAAPGVIAGNSLRVVKEATMLRLDWNPECGGGIGYGLYRGNLLSGYSSLAPLAGFCGIGTTSVLIDPASDSYFFLIAPNDGSVEGSLGLTSAGTRRGQPAQVCYPRASPVNACAP